MPTDHLGLGPRGKEAAAAASFPLGEGLGWSKLQPRLIYARVVVSVYTQIDTSCFTIWMGGDTGMGH